METEESMGGSKNLRRRLTVVIAVSAVIVLFYLSYTMLLSAEIKSITLFLLFQLLCVLLPGITFVRIFKVKPGTLEYCAAVYGLGLLFNITVYFLFAPFLLTGYIPWALYGSAPVFIVILFLLRKGNRRIPFSRQLKTAVILSGFICILSFVFLSLSNLTPDITGARGYHHDLTNGISLITSASFGFPMEFLQMSGTTHYYHPFFFAYCACLKLSTGISAFDIGTKYSLVTIAPFFALSFISLIRRILFRTRAVIAAFILLFLSFPPLLYYITLDLLGFSLSLGFACCSVLFYLKGDSSTSKFLNRNYLLSILFMVGCLGAKGSNGVTLVFSLCFALLLSFFRGNKKKRTAVVGLVYAVSFFAAYFLLYRQGATGMILRADLMLSDRFKYFSSLPEGWPKWLRVVWVNLFFTIQANPGIILCLLIIVISYFIIKKKLNPITDIALGGILCGLTLSNMFLQYGSSEIYFLYTAIPFAAAATMYCSVKLFSVLKGRKRTVFVVLAAIVLLPAVCFGAAETLSGIKYMSADALEYSPFSSGRLFSEDEVASIRSSKRPSMVTPEEYEGLLWIRDNTEKSAIIAEGRYIIYNKYFLGTAFCERRFWLEGWGYVTMEDSNENTPEKVRRDSVMSLFYGVQDESFVPLLRNLGIDYVVIYQYQNPGWYFTNEFGSSTVFCNRDIAVYDIRA